MQQNRALAALCLLAIVGVVAVVVTSMGSDASVPAANAQAPDAAQPAEVAPATTSAPARARSVTVAAVGDTVMGTPEFGLPPAGGSRLFSAVKPLLTGDVVMGNLESALATGPSTKCSSGSGGSCFAFASPPSYARNLKAAGFTAMATANNHANDWGSAGVRSTGRALDAVGIVHAGRPGEIGIQKLPDGTKVALVGLAPYAWSQNALDIAAATRLVRKAATMAPIVIANMHVGAEGTGYRHVPTGAEAYLGEPRGNARALARGMVDAGADLVVGNGPHVMRGMEFRKGRLIAYSMGNFLGYKVFGTSSYTGQSGVLRVTLDPDGRFVTGRLAPVRLNGDGVPSPGGSSIRDVATLSRADFGRTAARIARNGTIRTP